MALLVVCDQGFAIAVRHFNSATKLFLISCRCPVSSVGETGASRNSLPEGAAVGAVVSTTTGEPSDAVPKEGQTMNAPPTTGEP